MEISCTKEYPPIKYSLPSTTTDLLDVRCGGGDCGGDCGGCGDEDGVGDCGGGNCGGGNCGGDEDGGDCGGGNDDGEDGGENGNSSVQ